MHNFFDLVDKRAGWITLSVSAFVLFGAALYFQHVMNLQPCVMCIEERMLMLSLALISLLPIIKPTFTPLRILGYLGVMFISYIGFDLAQEHVVIQKGEELIFAGCSIFPRVPEWLPLHQWLPSLFMPTGNCGDISWTFAGHSMVEWVRNIFAFYFALPVLMLLGRRKL